MNPDLERLVGLQRAETALRRAETELAEVPSLRSGLDARLAGERAALDGARSALGESQKSRRQLEAQLQDLEAKRSRYKGQLMEVKTNKEYTAMLHEIEGVEREIRAREDLVLAEMEKAEGLEGTVRREEQVFKAEEERHREERKRLGEEEQKLRAQAEVHRKERETVAAGIPADLLARFQRVAKLRGVAMAEVKDGVCQVCHLKLQPQMFVELKRNDEITECPACQRILYYEPPVPVTVVTP
jgi:predicted  nucleic acid-binding Zn-ribbon protein